MSNFFEGWRRKFGLLTLVMACVLMMGWIRSELVCDEIRFPTGKLSYAGVTSLDHSICLGICDCLDPKVIPTGIKWFTFKPQTVDAAFSAQSGVAWKWLYCGCRIGELIGATGTGQSVRFSIYVCPYWPIVVPLTLVSAFLLFIKPRPSTPKKITEPIPTEVN